MNKIQEKSPCCRGSIWRRGERRRQCSVCGVCWRVWQRKKGRKCARNTFEPLLKYIKNSSGSLSQQASKKKISVSGRSAQMRRLVKGYNQITPWPTAPEGELIAVVDAIFEYINKVSYVFYFIYLRPISSSKATIMPFHVGINETEGFGGWSRAFASLDPDVFKRITALACDSCSGLLGFAKRQGWVVQRCHFHLLARLSHHCSQRKFGKNPILGRHFQKLANIVITSTNEEQVTTALNELQEMKIHAMSKSFKTVLSGFLKHYQEYRAYINYPQLGLPNTSNTAEHFNSCIRDLQYRARGFRSFKSLSAWIEVLVKSSKTVTCNPKISAPN